MKRSLLLCAASLATLSAVGCASDVDEAGLDDVETAALQAPSSQSSKPSPKTDAYFTDVKANGTGCPAGTWDLSLAPDQQAFTLTFSAFYTEVGEKRVDVKNCQVTIGLHSPNGLSYQVTDFFYQGYMYLEDDVSIKQDVRYYFMGKPADGNLVSTEIEGPADDSFLINDTLKDVNLVWSPCGKDSTLHVNTNFRLLSRSGNTGYVNASAIDATTNVKARLPLGLKWKLKWKKCNG